MNLPCLLLSRLMFLIYNSSHVFTVFIRNFTDKTDIYSLILEVFHRIAFSMPFYCFFSLICAVFTVLESNCIFYLFLETLFCFVLFFYLSYLLIECFYFHLPLLSKLYLVVKFSLSVSSGMLHPCYFFSGKIISFLHWHSIIF